MQTLEQFIKDSVEFLLVMEKASSANKKQQKSENKQVQNTSIATPKAQSATTQTNTSVVSQTPEAKNKDNKLDDFLFGNDQFTTDTMSTDLGDTFTASGDPFLSDLNVSSTDLQPDEDIKDVVSRLKVLSRLDEIYLLLRYILKHVDIPYRRRKILEEINNYIRTRIPELLQNKDYEKVSKELSRIEKYLMKLLEVDKKET